MNIGILSDCTPTKSNRFRRTASFALTPGSANSVCTVRASQMAEDKRLSFMLKA